MNVRLNSKMGVLVMALVLAACAAPPPPAADSTAQALPAQWPGRADCAASAAVTADWWRSFGSAELDALVRQAQAQSLDVAAAVARVQQAGAAARIAGAALLPEVNASLNASRQQRLGGNASVAGNVLGAGLNASYEIDFWGRNRADRDSALATLQASAFDRAAAQRDRGGGHGMAAGGGAGRAQRDRREQPAKRGPAAGAGRVAGARGRGHAA
jgi:outer membrane protein TolC